MNDPATVDGPAIWATMKSVRELHRSVSALLVDASAFLTQQHGMASAGTACLSYGTYQVNLPDLWMPSTLFRFFWPQDRREVLAWVSVVLAPRHPEYHLRPFTEPIASAGWARFGSPILLSNTVYGMASLIAGADCDRDGSWAGRSKIKDQALPNLLDYDCLGVPLVRLVDRQSLVDLLCRPMAEAVATLPSSPTTVAPPPGPAGVPR